MNTQRKWTHLDEFRSRVDRMLCAEAEEGPGDPDKLVESVREYAADYGPDMAKEYGELLAAPATVRRMREALESDLLMLAMSHTTHWDPKGTHGLNCPACKAASEWRDLKRAALSATARRGKEPNDG